MGRDGIVGGWLHSAGWGEMAEREQVWEGTGDKRGWMVLGGFDPGRGLC